MQETSCLGILVQYSKVGYHLMSHVKQQNHNVYIHAYNKSPMGVRSACVEYVQKSMTQAIITLEFPNNEVALLSIILLLSTSRNITNSQCVREPTYAHAQMTNNCRSSIVIDKGFRIPLIMLCLICSHNIHEWREFGVLCIMN